MSESQFRIGAVSRLTGIPSDTLRVWERRYGVVEPHRTEGGSRLYSQDDIDRLSLIKRLVDSGHAIGTVANLNLQQLSERASQASVAVNPDARQAAEPARVVILGVTLPFRLAAEIARSSARGVEVIDSFARTEDFEAAAGELDVDVLVVEFPTLNEKNLGLLRTWQRSCSAGRAVVVYGFGSSLLVERLSDQGVQTLRFPVSWPDVYRACLPQPAVPTMVVSSGPEISSGEQVVPPRRYDDTDLSRLVNASVTIKCECPHHLADLIIGLSRFEQYSLECRNQTREDAALHAMLHGVTARARHSLEVALGRLLEVEGIDLVSNGGD